MLQRPSHSYSGESWASAAAAGAVPERLVIVTDAWHPQVNGVVRTYERLALEAVNRRGRAIVAMTLRTATCGYAPLPPMPISPSYSTRRY